MPGLRISIRADVKALESRLSDLAKKQLPYAKALAVNDLAFQVMRDENAAMSQIFAHPRPFTQRATQVERRATKSTPSAVVSIRPAQAKYLTPYEVGGIHETPGKALLNPKDVRLDQYGQLAKGAPKRLAARTDVFIGTVHGVSGFWQRLPPPKGKAAKALAQSGGTAQQLRLLIRFGDALPVQPTLHFQDRARALIQKKAGAALRDALVKAVGLAKKP